MTTNRYIEGSGRRGNEEERHQRRARQARETSRQSLSSRRRANMWTLVRKKCASKYPSVQASSCDELDQLQHPFPTPSFSISTPPRLTP
ncbi:hypothetical protein Naga_100492g1 [Nannochloropsis gaditana]|uniref:Uncharacterized protein n=1 Tax=Nannochloropsis gaditana TaxID=72520 RepID=W7THL2_9STRA|nr:hypothetical protein Naga_100492g1 [Nannochloropsis gaditana]